MEGWFARLSSITVFAVGRISGDGLFNAKTSDGLVDVECPVAMRLVDVFVARL